MRFRIPVRLAPPAALAGLLAAGGCAVVDQPRVPGDGALAAPVGYAAAPVQGGASPIAAYGAGVPAHAAPAYVGGPGPAVLGAPDPYCREAQQEARAAVREAEVAARDARVGAYAGAPDWAQAQDARRAASAAAEADRARRFAARDCR